MLHCTVVRGEGEGEREDSSARRCREVCLSWCLASFGSSAGRSRASLSVSSTVAEKAPIERRLYTATAAALYHGGPRTKAVFSRGTNYKQNSDGNENPCSQSRCHTLGQTG